MIDLVFSAALNALFGSKTLAEQPVRQQGEELKTAIARGLVCWRSVPWERPMSRENPAWAGKTDSLVACVNHCKILLWKLPSCVWLSWRRRASSFIPSIHSHLLFRLVTSKLQSSLQKSLWGNIWCVPIASQGPSSSVTAWRRIGKMQVTEIVW